MNLDHSEVINQSIQTLFKLNVDKVRCQSGRQIKLQKHKLQQETGEPIMRS